MATDIAWKKMCNKTFEYQIYYTYGSIIIFSRFSTVKIYFSKPQGMLLSLITWNFDWKMSDKVTSWNNMIMQF